MEKTRQWRATAQGLIRMAVLAPSSHNTQPWFFRVSDSKIELLADRQRSLPINDPNDRELSISCGCALFNLRLAAEEQGLQATVAVLPEGEYSDVLARLSFDERDELPSPANDLLNCIKTRKTYRKKFLIRDLSEKAVNEVHEAARKEGAILHSVAEPSIRQEIARLIEEGDAMQWSNPAWRRELAAWMAPRSRGEGLSIPGPVAPLVRLVVRMFNMGATVGRSDRKLAESAPYLGVLTTDGDTVYEWLQAGQALQRALLTGCRYGLQAAFLNQPIQLASLRAKIKEKLGSGTPQILLRFGYPGRPQTPPPRKPCADVVEWL